MRRRKNRKRVCVFNNCTFNRFRDAQNSIIAQGNSGNLSATNGIYEPLSDMERELLRMFRAFPMRIKVEIQSYFYFLEDRLKEAKRHAAKK